MNKNTDFLGCSLGSGLGLRGGSGPGSAGLGLSGGLRKKKEGREKSASSRDGDINRRVGLKTPACLRSSRGSLLGGGRFLGGGLNGIREEGEELATRISSLSSRVPH